MKNLYLVFLLLSVSDHIALGQSTSGPPINLKDGIIAWYPFNGNSNDESGNNNDAINHSAALATDRFGHGSSAYYFDGLTSYLSCPSIKVLDNSTAMTISIWTKITGYNSSHSTDGPGSQFLISRGNDSETGHFKIALSQVTGASRFAETINSTFSSPSSSLLSTNLFVIPQLKWHHIVMTYGSGVIKLYVDGKLENMVHYNLSLGTNDSPIFIGKNLDASFPYFTKGYLDDIGIWNRALTAHEVQQLFNLPSTGLAKLNSNKSSKGSHNYNTSTNATSAGTRSLSEHKYSMPQNSPSTPGSQKFCFDDTHGSTGEILELTLYDDGSAKISFKKDGEVVRTGSATWAQTEGNRDFSDVYLNLSTGKTLKFSAEKSLTHTIVSLTDAFDHLYTQCN